MTKGYLASLAQARADSQHATGEEARAAARECTQEENLLAAQLILDQLHATNTPLDDLEPVAGDDLICEQCAREAPLLYVYGAFRLCRGCATHRLHVAQPAFKPAGAPTPLADPDRRQRPLKPQVGDIDYLHRLTASARARVKPTSPCELCGKNGGLHTDGRYFCPDCARSNSWRPAGATPPATERHAA